MIGRVAFIEAAPPSAQPVNYLLDEEEIILRTANGSEPAAAARHAVVASQVDEFDSRTRQRHLAATARWPPTCGTRQTRHAPARLSGRCSRGIAAPACSAVIQQFFGGNSANSRRGTRGPMPRLNPSEPPHRTRAACPDPPHQTKITQYRSNTSGQSALCAISRHHRLKPSSS
ncbi:pyridoxamine 5'-phosphate oxidase family protein [Pseudonocardia sp. GCM10023141]|uniref:pyridoxamine 5'-phosphate oxidase family protein n=1 Tax=Pseudonocardia sp. GCM10023141 TaxID=3252653 RepID=UPI0036238FC6